MSWTLAKIDLPEDEIKMVLEQAVPMTERAEVNEWTYQVDPAKEIPPEQELFVSPAQERLRYR